MKHHYKRRLNEMKTEYAQVYIMKHKTKWKQSINMYIKRCSKRNEDKLQCINIKQK